MESLPPSEIRLMVDADGERNIQNFCDAANSGALNYEGLCGEHGWTKFKTKTRKCVICHGDGVKKLSDDPRPLARRAGERTYLDNCETHGDVPHDTIHGKCLSCFNTAGMPRPTPRPDQDTVRIEARRAGDSSYIDVCEKHGETAHGVQYGKCLKCFTTMGAKRKMMRIDDA